MSQELFFFTFNVERRWRQIFLVAVFNKGMQVTMEPPGYPLVTTTTLTSYLAYLRQTMATLLVHAGSGRWETMRVASILLVGVWELEGGARLIRDLGGNKTM